MTTANPHYWDGVPLVKELDYVFITDQAALTNALLSGDVDGAYNVGVSSRAQFEASTTGRLILGPSTGSFSFGPLTSTGPAADPRIREAISLAIDRRQYIDTVLNGLGFALKTFTAPFAWNGMPASAAKIYQAGYDALPDQTVDLDKAKRLVAEVRQSGTDLSRPLVLAVPAGDTVLAQTAAIIQSAARSVGLTLTIDQKQPTDFTAMFYDPSAAAGVDLMATNAYIDTPGALEYAQLFALPADQGGSTTGATTPTMRSPPPSARHGPTSTPMRRPTPSSPPRPSSPRTTCRSPWPATTRPPTSATA